MSWLSVTLRKEGLGGIVDAFDGVEGAVKKTVETSPPVEAVEHKVITDVGSDIVTTFVKTVGKFAPGATTIATDVAEPLVSAFETWLQHFLNGAAASEQEGTMPGLPQAAPPKKAS